MLENKSGRSAGNSQRELEVRLLVPSQDVQNPELSIVIPALNEEITIAYRGESSSDFRRVSDDGQCHRFRVHAAYSCDWASSPAQAGGRTGTAHIVSAAEAGEGAGGSPRRDRPSQHVA
jgi:hypothetical protein